MIAGTLEIQLLANMARLQRDMDDARRAVGGAMSDIERHVGAAKAALGGLAAGLLGGLSVAGLVNVASKAIDAADAMNDLSQRVGISVKDLAKYELASKQSGTSMESLSKGIKGLAVNMSEHGDALKKAGITATDADGAMKQLASVFAAMPDGMEKTTLAVKLFGKSGMDLIPMLNMGADGLEKAAEKSAKYAAQMAAMAPMADAYNDNMAELAMHNKVASMSMLNELLPALVAITGAMADAAKNGGFLKGVMAGLDEFGNQAFDWSGNNARKGIRTLTKDLEDLQVQQARITIDIFGAKGSIQTQIEEKTKALEAARKAYYGFTDGSAGGGRGSVNPANVKPATDTLADYKALMAALEETKKKTGDANKELDRQAKLLAELSGLSGSFAEDWARLNAVYAAGKLTTEQLVQAQAALLAKQPAMQAAHKEQIEAAKAHTKAVDDEIDALEKLYQANEGQIRSARTMLEAIEFETRLLGMNAEQRALATMERDLERQGIVAGTQAYEAYIAKLREATEIKGSKESNIKAAQEAAEEWKKTSESINSTLTDALMRGFESGKDFAKNMRDVIVNMFKTMVLRPVISAIVNPVAQGITGMLGLGGVANAGTMDGGAFGTAAAAASIFGAGGIGGALAGGAGWLTGSTTLGGALSAGASLIGTGTAAGAASGAGMIVGALAPIALGIGALVAIANATKGETRSGGQYSYSAATGTMFAQGPSGGQIAGTEVQAAITGTVDSINKLLHNAGSAASISGFQAGLESSDKGRGGVFSGGTLSTGATFGESGKGNNYDGTLYERTSATSLDSKAALENFTTDLVQGTLQALQSAADIPQSIADMLKGVDAEALSADAANKLLASVDSVITGVSTLRDALAAMGLKELGFDAAAGLIAAAGGMDKLGNSLSSYYDNFYTEAEKTANTTSQIAKVFEGLGIPMLDLSSGADSVRESFRSLVDTAMADTTAKGQETTVALLGVSGSLGSLITNAQTAAAAMETSKVGQIGGNGRTVLGASDAAAYASDPLTRATIDGLQSMADLANTISTTNVAAIQAEEAARHAGRKAAMMGEQRGVKEMLDTQTKLVAEQQKATDSLRRFTDSLQDFLNLMNVTELGANSPEMRLQASRAEYERIYKEVSTGDYSEQDKLTGAARSLLDNSRSYNASGAGFVADEAFVRSTVGAIVAVNNAQLSSGEVVAELKTMNERMAKIERHTSAQVQVSQAAGTQTVEQLKTGNARQAAALSNAKFESLRHV